VTNGQRGPDQCFAKKRLRRAIAANDLRHKRYPVGTIVQVLPFEAMVKRGGGASARVTCLRSR